MPKNSRWTREELILALDTYLMHGTGSKSSNFVVELSSLLNQLRDRNNFPDPSRFRNPNGTSMKLSNFARLDPNYKGVGLARGGRLEVEIWNTFECDRPALAAEVSKITSSIGTAARGANTATPISGHGNTELVSATPLNFADLFKSFLARLRSFIRAG